MRRGSFLFELLLVLIVLLSLSVGGSMARGMPDWDRIKKEKAVSPIGDLGELAVRLGSIVSFDRRGNVIWMDDFEDGVVKWILSGTGIGWSVSASSDTALGGGQCAKLVTGDAANDWARIERYWAYPKLSRIGIEFAFTTMSGIKRVDLEWHMGTGSRELIAALRYYHTDKYLDYYNSAGGWTTLDDDIILWGHSKLFHIMKLVVDPNLEEYVRLIVDSTEYDMEGVGLRAIDNPISPRMWANFTVYTGEYASKTMYVDNVIITQNEP